MTTATAVSPMRETWRWAALALVFAAALLNYLDRQTIAFLKAPISSDLGWSDTDYAHVVSAFQLATLLTMLLAGWFVDRVGVRTGYSVGVGGWSLAQMAHALVSTVPGFFWVRAALGATEAVNLPAAVKTVASWFRGEDRSLALGVMNAAPNVGAMLAPFVVAGLYLTWGWKAAFIATGAIGVVWLAAWAMLPRPKQVEPVTRHSIRQDLRDLGALARDRRAWAIAMGKFLSDFVWVFLFFWTPDLFSKRYGVDMASGALPVAIVFTLAGLGSLIGGWSASRLRASGLSLNASRKIPMLVAAFIAIPVPLMAFADNLWIGVLLAGTTLAAHQAFSTNMFGLATDVFQPSKVGLAIGFGATIGAFSGLAMNEFTGFALEEGWGFAPMLALCAVGKFAGLGVVHWLVPDIDKTREAMLAADKLEREKLDRDKLDTGPLSAS